MERRRRAANLNMDNNMVQQGNALVARQQRWTGAGSGSGSSSSSSSSGYGSSGYGSSSKTVQYPPLQFTCALDHFQFACKDIHLSFTGGLKPYALSAFWFTDGKKNDATWVELKEKTWDESFQWNIIAPVSSQLLFTITDARGVTITSDDAINVITNGKGMSQDTWCQYVYNSSPVPTADVDGSHKYAWNASSEDDGNNDAAASSASSNSNHATSQMDGTATSTYASKVTASDSVDTNATDLNDKSTTISKAIHDANQAKTIEGVLAALLGVSLIALFALFLLFRKTRRRLREARSQLATRLDAQGGGGASGMMMEKPGGAAGGGHFYSPPHSGAITPRAGRNGAELRNPFDDASAVAMHPHQYHPQQHPRSPFLAPGGMTPNDGPRQSVTSLISAVPSNAGRSTAGNSAISTEFYNTYKASTIPPRDPNDQSNRGNSPFGGVMRSLFAPISFFSSATPSPNPSTASQSRANSRSNASVTTSEGGRSGDTSTLNTEFYGDRNSLAGGRPAMRSVASSEGTIHDDDGRSSIPVTRQSTRSEFTTSSTSTSGNHLAPSSAASTFGRPRRSLSPSSSSSNGGDISSVIPSSQHEDVYTDSDVASFSNFSFVDTRSIDEDDDRARQGGSSDEGSTTVVEPPRNPFISSHEDEESTANGNAGSGNKRRSWNMREYTELDKDFMASNSSLGS
ncbi:hypothetical protein P389DRAFT_207977 [Cystobasidium minutum MCA 4210]|uniref:uncharacterized protein n=1 Tax=Cystobasidium minutum MCA 4210 TaxID=1397322 RepID=UPI0034CD8133|eukprot:jgi/Rhomi1/207977/estExt_Genemark1.C_1_t20470